jgi:hypothetical protein
LPIAVNPVMTQLDHVSGIVKSAVDPAVSMYSDITLLLGIR